MYMPLNYNQINLGAGTYSPSSVKSYNNKSFAFWERSLFQRMTSVIDFELPDAWSGKIKDFFLYCLYRWGFVCISENEKFGQFFQPCSLSGYTFYYQPSKAIIANPEMNIELEIGSECQILKLTPDYLGAWDVIWYFAEKFSTLDNAINMSLINCKYPFFLGAKNKTASAALKKMLDLANKGEPAVIFDMKLNNDPTDKDIPFQIWDRGNLKNSYLTSDQLQDFQTLMYLFDSEIGIPTEPYQKKERMVTSEVEMKQADALARSETWIKTIQSSIDEVKKLYPDIKLTAELHYNMEDVQSDQEGGEADE